MCGIPHVSSYGEADGGPLFHLEIIGASSLAPQRILTARPTLIGRAPECDIVLSDPSISRRHANLWIDGTSPMVQDLDSRNGTFVGDVRVSGVLGVAPGQTIRLGHTLELRVQRAPVTLKPAPPLLFLESASTGLRVPITAEPLRIGSSPSAHLHLGEGPAELAVVIRQGADEVWLGIHDDLEEITIEEPFDLAGERFIVRRLPPSPHVTLADEATGNDYVIRASLDEPGGPVARVRSPALGSTCEVRAENRAVLLYVLARRWADDAAAGVWHADRGWIDDEEVATGVWGRQGAARSLKVIVCRVRQELRVAGFDPWCIEKRRGAIRICVAHAQVS